MKLTALHTKLKALEHLLEIDDRVHSQSCWIRQGREVLKEALVMVTAEIEAQRKRDRKRREVC